MKISIGTIIGVLIGVFAAGKGNYGHMGQFSVYGAAGGAVIGSILWPIVFRKKKDSDKK
jgi:hypothetical protein